MWRRWAGAAVTGPLAFFLSGLIDVGILGLYLERRRRAVRRQRSSGAPKDRRIVCGLAAALILTCAAGGLLSPSSARADSTEPSILMDDHAFIYVSPAQIERNLRQVAALGVNTIKVSMVWSLVAPDANSRTKPNFDAGNPSAYPPGSWTRYDNLLEEAGALGLKVYFQLTAPAPLWATTRAGLTKGEHDFSHGLNAKDFGQFVQAVGERYSGNWPAPSSGPEGGSPPTGGTILGGLGAPPSQGGSQSTQNTTQNTIPAVRMWGIWNEPNIAGWLSPQTLTVHHHTRALSPELYRALVDAGYHSLVATGHSRDTILIGETASGGEVHTIPFVNALYCLNARGVRLTGAAAQADGCPPRGGTRQFVADHPGLFAASGWAHHPYSFNHAPNTPLPGFPDTISLANLSRLESALDRADAVYGEPTGMPIYITEWGYKSNPPNPYVHTSLGQQETWLDEGWYMSYYLPRVKTMAQEELYDEPPVQGKKPGSVAYWSNFDSGLEFQNGRPKPSLAAFRLPIWLPVQRAGAKRTVWAEIRPAAVAHNPVAVLQFQARGSSSWSTLEQLRTKNPEGFVVARVNLPGPGRVRLAWSDPADSNLYYSRTVPIS